MNTDPFEKYYVDEPSQENDPFSKYYVDEKKQKNTGRFYSHALRFCKLFSCVKNRIIFNTYVTFIKVLQNKKEVRKPLFCFY